MYVRWKKRMRTSRRRPTGEHTLSAYLVESYRKDGQPRQRVVTYIGSIGEQRTQMHYHRLEFWKAAAEHINPLNLSDETVAAIRATLEAVVPLPTDESRKQALDKLSQLTQSISQS